MKTIHQLSSTPQKQVSQSQAATSEYKILN